MFQVFTLVIVKPELIWLQYYYAYHIEKRNSQR